MHSDRIGRTKKGNCIVNTPLLIIAILNKAVGSGVIHISPGQSQLDFKMDPIDEAKLNSVLRGLKREYQYSWAESIEGGLDLLVQQPRWSQAEIVLIDLPIVESHRQQLGQRINRDDLPQLQALSGLKSTHRDEASPRIVIGIFAKDDEGVPLIGAGCDVICELESLADTITEQLEQVRTRLAWRRKIP